MNEERKGSLAEIKALNKETTNEPTMIDNPDNPETGPETTTTEGTIMETRAPMIRTGEEIGIRTTIGDKGMKGQTTLGTTTPIRVNPTKTNNSTIGTISPTKTNHTKTIIKTKVNLKTKVRLKVKTKVKLKAIRTTTETNSNTIKDRTTRCRTILITSTTIDKGEITMNKGRVSTSPIIRDPIINNSSPGSTIIRAITPIEMKSQLRLSYRSINII